MTTFQSVAYTSRTPATPSHTAPVRVLSHDCVSERVHRTTFKNTYTYITDTIQLLMYIWADKGQIQMDNGH